MRRFAYAPAVCLCAVLASSPASSQQFNSSDGANRVTADSAFQLYWDSAADVMKFRCAASGAAGSAITWTDGPSLNTSCVLSGGVSTPSADSLDFTEFLDAMALDASTSITADNAEVLSIINTGTGNSFLVQDVASDTTPFVIDAAGNVGVGTTTPTAKLYVDGDMLVKSANGRVWGLDGFSTGHSVSLRLGDIYNSIDSTYGSETAFRSYNGTIFYGGTGTVVGRIGAYAGGLGSYFLGNIGIGETNPQSALHVPDGKYAQFQDNNAGAPPGGDCDADAERGRMSIDTSNNRIYFCNGATRGWDYMALTD
jgi:hypothetical protein